MLPSLAILVLVVAAAPAGERTAADPQAQLRGGYVVEIGADQELRRKERKDLEFAFPEGWEASAVKALRTELRGMDLAPPEGADPALVERPVRLRFVLTEVDRKSKDNTQLQSRESFVSISLAARAELYLPGEKVPRSTYGVDAAREATTEEGLSTGLFREAFLAGFHALAASTAGRAARRLRPERFEKSQESTFVPYRPRKK